MQLVIPIEHHHWYAPKFRVVMSYLIMVGAAVAAVIVVLVQLVVFILVRVCICRLV